MKILLNEEVRKLGKAGDVVEVSTGYARNFLIPKKLGVEASAAVLKEWKEKKASEAARRAKDEAEAVAKAAELNGKEVTVRAKAGENGKLFGTVTTQTIAEAMKEQLGFEIDKKKIVLPEEIKVVGDYTVTARLMANAAAELKLKVENDA